MNLTILKNTLAWLYWDPPRDAFTIPYFDIPVAWYGILFAGGFVIGYFLFIPMMQKLIMDKSNIARAPAKILAQAYADRLVWYVVLGTIIGARLGHVLFYEFSFYALHPLEIFMIRKGGLASHGGTLGVIIALLIFQRVNRKQCPNISLINLIDTLVVPTAFAVTCIRLGNFFNQEILGHVSSLPWAIIFGHAADGSAPVPRHPVQLYEAAVYMGTFALLYCLWRWKGSSLKPGILSGIFFILVFGSRIIIEFFKELQGSIIDESFLQMGQYLSIPFVLLGIYLIVARFGMQRSQI